MKQAAAIVLALMLAGCASKKGAQEDEPPSLVPPADPSPVSSPATDVRLAEMQTSMTELLERIDVLNARIARLESALNAERPVMSPAPATHPAEPPALVPHAEPVAEPAPAAATHPAPTRALRAAAVADSYRDALIVYGKGHMADARAAFQRVFDAEPTGELADNALFWIGETYFASGDYTNAMRYYERVTKEFADQNKAPDALFKMAVTYEKTGDLGMARKTFEECIRRYPYSSPASSAKLELKRIKY